MDITRLAVDAGAFINRAVQYTEEALGQAEKTELDSRLESLLDRAESTKTWTDKIISQTETLLQPNPGARLEDRLYKGLDWSAPQRPTPQELLSENMINAALELGQHTPYGSTLIKCGELERQIGMANKKLIQSTSINFLSPLRMFTDEECPVIQNERRQLVNKWLDLDIAKSRLRKAQEVENEARGLNADPLGEDYVAHVSYMFSFLRVRWQKMWAQEVSQAEMELRICQSLFDRQSEITRLLLEGINPTHAAHLRSLVDFVEAQASYYAQCYQLTQDLRMQLASGPSLGYNNNWPLETNEPSTRNLPIATIQPLAACGSLITNHTTCQSLPTNQANSLSLVTNQASDDSTANETWTAISTSSQAMVTPRAFTSNPVTL
ncbi:endophilin-B1 [Esox lucius]|uniref:BAR domain-containing protein n=1 Tax=Esox lucius TaxID=8010 RepID=A0A3P8ZN95_ESOLU|nr:endophilin-B1 [Esox lucius]XP_019897696.2 endophilin-B1 [Esox lucius]